MTMIRHIYECPHCEAPITSQKRPDKCPECGYSFGEAGLDYKAPMTLSEQHERLSNDLAHYAAILDLSMEKANSIMNDALNIIETLSAKKVKTSDIRYLVQMGKKIGEIATKYDEFIVAGGKHGPSLFLIEGDTSDTKKTADGEEPT